MAPGDRQAYLEALCRAVPFSVVEAVLADPTENAVRSRDVEGTVLHAKVVGLTSLCERLARVEGGGLERLNAILSRLFATLLDEALFPFDGYVMQFGGETLTAIFLGEDHALRAAAAAHAVQLQVVSAETDTLPFDPEATATTSPLLARIGIASGTVRHLVLGDVVQRSALVGGLAAHTAAMLAERAEPGKTLVSAAVATALRPHAKLAARRLEGLEEGVHVLGELGLVPSRQPIKPLVLGAPETFDAKIALLEPFVPPPLAARLKSTPRGWRIEGELRNVVVVFAEVAGFPHDMPAQTMLDLSRSFLRAYRKYGGIVCHTDLSERGQRIMVLFGLHLPSQNDGERAMLASLEASARVRSYIASIGPNLTMQAGVHSGQVYFGTFGSEHRHDITVVGDAVTTTLRLCDAAKPYEVLATETVYGSVRGEFSSTERPPFRVHGAEALGVAAIHSAADGVAHYVQTRGRQRLLAGRASEIDRVFHSIDRAWNEGGRLVGITGEPGTGKSALLSRAVDEWTRRGGLGLVGRCRFATSTQPLAPVIAMFSAFLGLTRGEDELTRRARIRSGLEPYGLRGGAEELMALLEPHGGDGRNEALVDLADSQARERVLSTILEFSAKRIEQEPILYVVEDLHYADSLTMDLAARYASISRKHPFLLLATYLPEVGSLESFRRTLDDEVTLGPLTDSQAQALVLYELGATAVDKDLLAFLQRRTGGNPAHLVDVVRFLRDRELLQVRAGLVSPPRGGLALLDDVVPATAASAALAQLDGLGEVERRLVRAASVIGESFSREMLELVSGVELDPQALGWAMDNLEAERVISPEFATATERGYTFRDEITRAAAYRTLPEEKRREIHRRIAEALERRPDYDAARDAAQVAAHRERAGELASAARGYEVATRAAMRATLYSEARHFYDRWHRCVEELPATSRPVTSARAPMDLMKLVAVGRLRLPAATLAQARLVLAEHGASLPERTQLTVDYWLGSALAWLGQGAAAREKLERVFLGTEDAAMRCEAALELAALHAQRGEIPEARRWLDDVAPLTAKDPTRAARATIVAASLASDREALQAARATCQKIHDEARAKGHLHLATQAAHATARAALDLGETEAAREGFDWALQLGRALSQWSFFSRELAGTGQALLWSGRAAEAREPLELALRYAREVDDHLAMAEATVHLGGALLRSSDLSEGAALAASGAALASRLGLSRLELEAHVHLFAAAVLRNDVQGIALERRRCAESRAPKTPLLAARIEELEAQAPSK